MHASSTDFSPVLPPPASRPPVLLDPPPPVPTVLLVVVAVLPPPVSGLPLESKSAFGFLHEGQGFGSGGGGVCLWDMRERRRGRKAGGGYKTEGQVLVVVVEVCVLLGGVRRRDAEEGGGGVTGEIDEESCVSADNTKRGGGIREKMLLNVVWNMGRTCTDGLWAFGSLKSGSAPPYLCTTTSRESVVRGYVYILPARAHALPLCPTTFPRNPFNTLTKK